MRVVGQGELAVVACQHGDEKFGKVVLDNIEADKSLSSRIKTVFANEPAYDANLRYIHTDLNRSFKRDDISGNEANLASDILEVLDDTQYLYDIHTTYSANFKALQIVSSLSRSVQMLLSHFDEEDIALLSPGDTKNSLIGNHPAGVALEFGREYANGDEPLRLCLSAIKGVVEGGYGKYLKKRVFEISSLIPNTDPAIPEDIQSGDYSEVHGGYVIMPKLPRDVSNYRGFLASRMYHLSIEENNTDKEDS